MVDLNFKDIENCIIFDDNSDLTIEDIMVNENIIIKCSSTKFGDENTYLSVGACLIKNEEIIYINIITTDTNKNIKVPLKKYDFDYIFLYDEYISINNKTIDSNIEKKIKILEDKNLELNNEIKKIKKRLKDNEKTSSSNIISENNIEHSNNIQNKKFSLIDQIRNSVLIDNTLEEYGLSIKDLSIIRENPGMSIIFELTCHKLISNLDVIFTVYNHENNIIDSKTVYLNDIKANSMKVEELYFYNIKIAEIEKIKVHAQT